MAITSYQIPQQINTQAVQTAQSAPAAVELVKQQQDINAGKSFSSITTPQEASLNSPWNTLNLLANQAKVYHGLHNAHLQQQRFVQQSVLTPQQSGFVTETQAKDVSGFMINSQYQKEDVKTRKKEQLSPKGSLLNQKGILTDTPPRKEYSYAPTSTTPMLTEVDNPFKYQKLIREKETKLLGALAFMNKLFPIPQTV